MPLIPEGKNEDKLGWNNNLAEIHPVNRGHAKESYDQTASHNFRLPLGLHIK